MDFSALKTNEAHIAQSSQLTDPCAQRVAAMTLEAVPFVSFAVYPAYLDENQIWNPRDADPPLEAAFQIEAHGTREHYLRLAEVIRQFAEQDSADDSEYHEHLEGVMSANGKVRLHLILRKDDVGDATWR